MRTKILLLSVLFVFSFLFETRAEKIEKKDAEKLAIEFLTAQARSLSKDISSDLEVSEVIVRTYNEVTVYYAVNFSQGGYVILSADDVLKPIIGYAYQGSYSASESYNSFSYFMNSRAEEAAEIILGQLPATPEIEAEWQMLRSGETLHQTPETLTNVQPMLTCLWNQDYPYNAFCPADAAGPGGHVYAGCVATAMSMIMYYYRYPEHGFGQKTHHTPYGQLYVNFGETYYKWDAMINTVLSSSGSSIPAVAELQYHCGIAVNMNYSPDGSGAQGQSVPSAIQYYFGYSNTANFLSRGSMAYNTWVNILKGQLDQSYPMYYQGCDGSGCHAWVCDGYEPQGNDTYFHMNWGWGAFGNGFFHLQNMNSGNGTFNSAHGIVRNFYPPSDSYPYFCSNETKVLTSKRGTFDDGSGPISNYQNNTSCSWLIAPNDSVISITINFLKFETQPNDIVTIYDGDTADDPVIGTFSGNALPQSITTAGNKMLITFVTDNSGTAPGWLAQFSSTIPVLCNGLVTHTNPTGEIADGSGSYNYNHNSFCRWMLKPTGANHITLSFNTFNLHPSDYVRIIQLPGNVILGNYSGGFLPPPVTSTTGQMMVIFSSDNYYNATGFEAEWFIDNVGIEERDPFIGLNLYPNPASELLNLSFSTSAKNDVTIQLFSAAGYEVYVETISGLNGKYQRAIDVSAFPSGIYILKISEPGSAVTRKIILD